MASEHTQSREALGDTVNGHHAAFTRNSSDENVVSPHSQCRLIMNSLVADKKTLINCHGALKKGKTENP